MAGSSDDSTNNTGGGRSDLEKIFGKKTSNLLSRIGVETSADLVRHYPRRYVERGEVTPLSQGEPGESVTYVARVKSKVESRVRSNTLTLTRVTFTDGQDEIMAAFFSKSKYTVNPSVRDLNTADLAMINGTIRQSKFGGARELVHPAVVPITEMVTADDLRPIAIYSTTRGLHNEVIVDCIKTLLPQYLDTVLDPVPEEVRTANGLLPYEEALRKVHLPETVEEAELARATLRFHEAFVLQTALGRRRIAYNAQKAVPWHHQVGGVLDQFDAALPFELTAGQVEVAAEIAADLEKTIPMQRLLQGEVGSGKTVVALRAMLQVIEAGGQAALLAPTEVLAAQHERSITAMLGPLADQIGVRLLTGSTPTSRRKQALLDAVSGTAGIVIGTHALLADNVKFFELGLIVIDEQHRFGVEQRDVLRTKATYTPHLLVMTATPIPRSVAMTIFGDVDTSTLRELPKGRSPIETHIIPEQNQVWVERMWARLAEEIDNGGRVYLVAPRIGGKDEGPVVLAERAAGEGTPHLRLLEFPDEPTARQAAAAELLSVADLVDMFPKLPSIGTYPFRVMHGQLPTADKDTAMSDFASGEVPILICTTVIEVGVDVPEATAIVIFDAQMFGLSQLHQLRGRIGRGRKPGICFIVPNTDSPTAAKRLYTFAGSTDGFDLAEADLKFRGEGDVLGAAQAGMTSSLKLLRVTKDADIIAAAREAAWELLREDPHLFSNPALGVASKDPEGKDFLDRG